MRSLQREEYSRQPS